MSIKVAIHHQTKYEYDKEITIFPHIFRLKPAPHSRTPILAYSFKILPENHFINWQQDPFGNYQARVSFPEKTKFLQIDVEVIAEMVAINPFDFFIEKYADNFPFEYDEILKKELVPYLEISEKGAHLLKLVSEISRESIRMVDFLVALNQKVSQLINYNIRMEPGVQTCEETLERKNGSCRDTAWLLVQIFRHLGLAARFVSGYLIQLKADQKALDGPSGTEIDFTDLHAWAEVYVPGAGWIGLDGTSGLFTGEGHIPLSCTPFPASAAPVTGATEKVDSCKFSFKNEVIRIHEDPRVTKPYSDEQWAAIYALGQKVDEDLEKGDVRLTMGGEPTFVSIDDMESEQWNTSADGTHKRERANELIQNLRKFFGKQGLIHFGQGKWYPGEPIPRWALSLYWRNDNLPLWKDNNLLADLSKDYKLGYKEANLFGKELSKYLGVNPDNLCTGYEDAFYFMWEEGKLPVNIDPIDSNLKNSLERKTLLEHLDKGLSTPTGYVLPMQWNHSDGGWISCKWIFRRNYMFLVPGNSPMGLRLPLESLPITDPAKKEKPVERSSFDFLEELKDYTKSVSERYDLPYSTAVSKDFESGKKYKEIPKTDAEGNVIVEKAKEKPDEVKLTEEIFTVRTALTIEPREGKIYIFFPPLTHLEHYLDLLASVEATAEKLKIPVIIEGYEAPKDSRISKMMVTPDPGVIEVNIHPSKTWKDLVERYDVLFEQARLSRLGSEKFMLDGKHTGTGGGNHITIGGVTPQDSPILRKPHLLRSLITYWQHHPGLSYLFSTAFVGPTSQSPRVDEGRPEMLYELEIAFDQIPEGDEEVPFWLVDRIFRNLLIDITGNTHRSEFCIDKLYSPNSSTGRLGILEFRAFDMPPNKQMCVLQLLLIRSLIAMFWNKPYKKPLIRWGTELYDKFMLGHYVKEDLKEVVADLNEAGYPFQLSWLEPFFEFRFPLLGKVQVGAIQLDIKFAIEPWHVLGEEMSNSGTARFVDSSMERVELKISGMTESRHVITCNGARIPFRSTGTAGEFIAGIKYRAWQPPSALHPNIGVDTPLVFDVIDTWNGKSIGGCTYYVAHPGGRSYDTFPVNANEAEGRRISRFWNHGHTQETLRPAPYLGTVQRFVAEHTPIPVYDLPPVKVNPEYPSTLDLRKLWVQS